jgi:hypothetical protein
MVEEFVHKLTGRGLFSPVGEEPYEVDYNLDEYQSYLRDGRSYNAPGKTEWRHNFLIAIQYPSTERTASTETGRRNRPQLFR